MATNGWSQLGTSLGSLFGGGDDAAYQKGQTSAARVAGLIADARIKRDEAMARDSIESALIGSGMDRGQAGVVATVFRGGWNPEQLSGYTGDMQAQDIRGQSLAAAQAGNATLMNDLLSVYEGKPRIQTSIADGTAFNPYGQASQQTYTTDVGQSTIRQRDASAAASYASAENSRASARRTQQAMGIDLQELALKQAGGGGRPLSAPTINRLAEDAEKLTNLQSLAESFNPDYANSWTGGQVENFLGRLGWEGGWTGATPGQANWWQQYDRQKNVIRNELFGAALTPNEQAEFDKADINPNMSDGVIKANLKMQADIVQRGLQRQARTWAAQGYNRGAIQEATGLADAFGASVLPGAATASGGPVQIGSRAEYQALPVGAEYVDPNGQIRRKR